MRLTKKELQAALDHESALVAHFEARMHSMMDELEDTAKATLRLQRYNRYLTLAVAAALVIAFLAVVLL